VDRYIRIQTQIWRTQNPDPTDVLKSASRRQRRITRLNQKIQKIRRDILFESDIADSIWSEKLDDLQFTHQQILREQSKTRRTGVNEASLKPKDTQENKSSSGELATGGEARDEDEVLLGGIFAETEEGSSMDQRDDEPQENIRVVDFGKWTGVSPRKLLEEICRSHDAKCRIQVHPIQSTASSTRHNLIISWKSAPQLPNHAITALPADVIVTMAPGLWTLTMRTIAAVSKMQSEAYISSLALFLMSTMGNKEQKVTSRLPTVWRDQLKELSDTRQDLANEEYKTTLRELRAAIKKAQDDSKKRRNQGPLFDSTQQSTSTDARRLTHRPAAARLSKEQVLQEWRARTSLPAFDKMLEIRQQLPVHSYKDVILDCINNNAVSVICAETGAGKSSGIPVLLLEQDFVGGNDCRILVTQPRRISAITLPRRVSQELGEARSDIGTARSLVGYAIRMESKTSSSTRITYATTGVLLRMLEDSPDLDELDYLILDEVHERTMDLDLLFIALRKLQQRRKTLKIILMSATVDAKKFSDYFGGAPVLDLPVSWWCWEMEVLGKLLLLYRLMASSSTLASSADPPFLVMSQSLCRNP
jgi:ATP-dependent RNA helicase DHX29